VTKHLENSASRVPYASGWVHSKQIGSSICRFPAVLAEWQLQPFSARPHVFFFVSHHALYSRKCVHHL
jgi:hypothetical protein